MADVTGPDGTVYSDGPYSGVCSREKKVRSFYGTVWVTDLGRIMATGPCDTCGTAITRVLYYP